MSYAEWIALANEHVDQNLVWRSHEFNARKNYRADDLMWIDLGGEG